MSGRPGKPSALRSLARRGARHAVALGTVALLAATAVVLVENADGDFAATYHVVGSFPDAGQGLHPGSEVDEHGVQIGTVSSVTLAGGRARVVLAIADAYRLPTDVVATISGQNLFGADDVSLTVPSGTPATAPDLHDGSAIGHTAIEDDLSDLFSAAAPLLSQLDTTDLSRLVAELAEASRGEGPAIAASLDDGTKLADLLSRTSVAQLQALDSFTRFAAVVSTVGPELDQISADSNETLPLFAQAAGAYAALLADLGALSGHVSALLDGYEPDIATILDAGGNVTRVLVADQPDLEYLVYGLAQYAYRFAHAGSPAALPDGSRFGYFQTFLEWSDVVNLVCGLIAPARPGLSFLAPLQSLVSTPGSPFDCSSEIAAFDKAQRALPSDVRDPASALPPTATPAGAGSAGAVAAGGPGAATGLVQQLYQDLAAPSSTSGGSSIGTYVASLLGAA